MRPIAFVATVALACGFADTAMALPCTASCEDYAHEIAKCNDTGPDCTYIVGLICIESNPFPNAPRPRDVIASINAICTEMSASQQASAQVIERRRYAIKVFSDFNAILAAWEAALGTAGSSEEERSVWLANLNQFDAALLGFGELFTDVRLKSEEAGDTEVALAATAIIEQIDAAHRRVLEGFGL